MPSLSTDQTNEILAYLVAWSPGLEDTPVEQIFDDAYSGRGMYGERCIGFTLASIREIMLLGAAVAHTGVDPDFISSARTDNMGHDTIVYFPGWTVDPPTPGNDCSDCGTPTYCGRAHGGDHDHSPAARECSANARGLL